MFELQAFETKIYEKVDPMHIVTIPGLCLLFWNVLSVSIISVYPSCLDYLVSFYSSPH